MFGILFYVFVFKNFILSFTVITNKMQLASITLKSSHINTHWLKKSQIFSILYLYPKVKLFLTKHVFCMLVKQHSVTITLWDVKIYCFETIVVFLNNSTGKI